MHIPSRFKPLSILLPLLIGSVAAQAAQQYVVAAGAYGPVTVTMSGCPTGPPFNPYTAAGRTGFAIVTSSTCTLTFSPAISTSSLTIDIDGNNTGDVNTFSLNGTAYTPVSADLGPVLVPALTGGTLSISGSTITGNGSTTLRFTNSPPATVTSLSISLVPGGAGTFYRVGFDDTVTTPPPAAVPTLSPWAMAALIAGFFVVYFHMSKLARS